MLIFVSEKNRPLLLAKGVDACHIIDDVETKQSNLAVSGLCEINC